MVTHISAVFSGVIRFIKPRVIFEHNVVVNLLDLIHDTSISALVNFIKVKMCDIAEFAIGDNQK